MEHHCRLSTTLLIVSDPTKPIDLQLTNNKSFSITQSCFLNQQSNLMCAEFPQYQLDVQMQVLCMSIYEIEFVEIQNKIDNSAPVVVIIIDHYPAASQNYDFHFQQIVRVIQDKSIQDQLVEFLKISIHQNANLLQNENRKVNLQFLNTLGISIKPLELPLRLQSIFLNWFSKTNQLESNQHRIQSVQQISTPQKDPSQNDKNRFQVEDMQHSEDQFDKIQWEDEQINQINEAYSECASSEPNSANKLRSYTSSPKKSEISEKGFQIIRIPEIDVVFQKSERKMQNSPELEQSVELEYPKQHNIMMSVPLIEQPDIQQEDINKQAQIQEQRKQQTLPTQSNTDHLTINREVSYQIEQQKPRVRKEQYALSFPTNSDNILNEKQIKSNIIEARRPSVQQVEIRQFNPKRVSLEIQKSTSYKSFIVNNPIQQEPDDMQYCKCSLI